MSIRAAAVAAASWFAFTPAVSAQRIYFGAVGGTGLTSSFAGRDIPYSGDEANGFPASRFQWLGGSRSLIFGAMVECRISNRFSVEANVLRRPLNSKVINSILYPQGAQTTIDRSTAVKAWEFPVMLKYTMPALRFGGGLMPFVEAGPSIRTQEDPMAVEPSKFGASVGAGIAMRLGRIRLAPSLRYTRWRRESLYPRYETKPDQVEFLTSVGYETDSDSRRVAGHTIELGAIAGLPLTANFSNFDLSLPVEERFRFLAGIALQVNVHRGLGIEADGIYKPMRAGSDVVLTWQIPVLAKYTWTRRRWSPFVEAGPSFRLAGNLNGFNPSHYGATAAVGVETRGHGVRLAPAVRYTRWAKDLPRYGSASASYDYPRTNPNALELVAGISF